MRKHYTYSFYSLLLLFLIGFHQNSHAQTYATPELKEQAEKWEAEKNKKNDKAVVTETARMAKDETQPAFDYSLTKDAFKLQKIEAIDSTY